MKSQLQSEPCNTKDDRLKEDEEEEETVRRPIPSRQVTVGFRLSVAVDRSQQEMERYTGRNFTTLSWNFPKCKNVATRVTVVTYAM
eukprot:scaffold29419_cov99-Amphora_coffeaeformis.AAC.1